MTKKNKRRGIHPNVDDTSSAEYHRVYMQKYVKKITGRTVKPRKKKHR